MHPKSFQRSLLASAVLTVLALPGCGGGGGGGGDTIGDPTAPSVSGVVADGYLVGATVCLDVNENRICDPTEPKATTGAGGTYKITYQNSGDTNHPIVVEVSVGTVDEDTGKPVNKSYVLTAPAGKPEFVSPLTTMVQTVLEQNPALTVEDAEAAVKDSLGQTADSTVDLFTDYVAAKDDAENEDAPEYEQLHRVAQVVARVMEANHEAIEQAAADAGLDVEQVMDSVVRTVAAQVMAQLGTIVQEVEEVEDAGGDFNPDDLAKGVPGADPNAVVEDIEQEEEAAGVAVANPQEILQGGINMLDSMEYAQNQFTLGYERIGLAGDNSTLTMEANWQDPYGGWQTYAGYGYSSYLLNSSGGWVPTTDTDWTVSFSGDKALISRAGGADVIKISGAVQDVSTKPIADFVDDDGWANWILSGATFSDGAKAYRWTETRQTGLYEIPVVSPSDCDGFGADYGNNCNVALAAQANPQGMAAATSLDQVMYPADFAFDQASTVVRIGENLGVQFVGDANADTGVLRFVKIQTGSMMAAPNQPGAPGTWSKKTVNGVTMIMFDVPPAFRDMLLYDESPRYFLAVQGGYVRAGAHAPAGTVSFEDKWNFNDKAMKDILTNLD